jgi:peptidoglycan/LPS O-acetylase OafA/YrhL
VWPWVVLLVRRCWLTRVLPAIILSSILFRLALLDSPVSAGLLPFACLDTLGMGAFLAVATEFRMQKSLRVVRLLCVAAGLPLPITVVLLNYMHRLQSIQDIFTGTATGLVAASLILSCAEPSSRIGGFLSFRPLTYLGRNQLRIICLSFTSLVSNWV